MTGRQPEWWNPLTGERRILSNFEESDGVTSIPLRLGSLESGFILFRGEPRPSDAENFPESQTLTTLEGAISLGLGNFCNLAFVRLNGKDLGSVWCAPWKLSVPQGLLKKTGNTLEVTVANLWINRLIKDSGLPEAERLTSTTHNPYQPDGKLQPSGLLGPVTVSASP